MGIAFSWPFGECSTEMDNGSLDSMTVKSISFGDEERAKTPLRSISFKISDSEPTILKSCGSGKMILEGSVSFKGRDLEETMTSAIDEAVASSKSKAMDVVESLNPDFSLESSKESRVSDLNNPQMEAAIRLQKVYKSFRTRRKLADCAVLVEQSWWKLLDFAELKRSSISFFDMDKHETAISRWSRARTRAAKVGKGLFKNDKAQKLALQHWLEAIDPRHRLDIGEGKEVNIEKCPRLKLQQQCIKYLGPVSLYFYYSLSSLFWPHSGHYRPTEENFNDFISFLRENDVDLTDVKMAPVDGEESFHGTSHHLRCNSSEENSLEPEENSVKGSIEKLGDLIEEGTSEGLECTMSSRFLNLSHLEIPMKTELFEVAVAYNQGSNSTVQDETMNENDHNVEAIAEESILQRINSKKGMKSYQLGKQLSCKWTTGAGPRIGCVRDFPSELQFRALEQVNLSPKSDGYTKLYFSPRSTSGLNPKFFEPVTTMREEMRTQSLPLLKKENLLQKSFLSLKGVGV
ncbi:Myeloid differentiation primary response MyD88 [Gossypium australe]|uniref:Myeloid differentiation primary response MyD88 n=1 Tax=Gossypium australe TaxID=47621 RepID=A0A5B6VRG0_9ROSI|nr:Myeloid differentiation primary response MyD88 [Gossypium australe]